MPTSIGLNSAFSADFRLLELGNSVAEFNIKIAFLINRQAADVEIPFLIILKKSKNSRNTISSIKFDRELRF